MYKEFAGASISCNDIYMRTRSKAPDPQLLFRTLAEFRYELRQFLHFSERAAVTIAYAAERLSLRHHSVVELVNRSEREGLLTRTVDTRDRRRAILQVTRKGERLLDRLAGDHARELKEMAPRLAKALKRIGMSAQDSAGSKTR